VNVPPAGFGRRCYQGGAGLIDASLTPGCPLVDPRLTQGGPQVDPGGPQVDPKLPPGSNFNLRLFTKVQISLTYDPEVVFEAYSDEL